jgi:integrase
MRPSEAAGLQWGDVDLAHSRAQGRRSRHLGKYFDPKTARACRMVERFPEVVRLLRGLHPLHVTPVQPVFTNIDGKPVEPNSLLPHRYAAQRACGVRVRRLYALKDTFVSTALQAGVKIAWLEEQPGRLRDAAEALRQVDAAGRGERATVVRRFGPVPIHAFWDRRGSGSCPSEAIIGGANRANPL